MPQKKVIVQISGLVEKKPCEMPFFFADFFCFCFFSVSVFFLRLVDFDLLTFVGIVDEQ